MSTIVLFFCKAAAKSGPKMEILLQVPIPDIVSTTDHWIQESIRRIFNSGQKKIQIATFEAIF